MGILEQFENQHWDELANEEEQYAERDALINKNKSEKLNIMVKSKIEKIVGEPKEWNGNGNGTVYYHFLEMENGDKINIGKKKHLAIGEELTYEITEQDGKSEYNKAKSVQEVPFEQKTPAKNDDYIKGIEVGHAINNAVNLICAGSELNIKECASNEEKIYETAKVIIAISHRLKSEI